MKGQEVGEAQLVLGGEETKLRAASMNQFQRKEKLQGQNKYKLTMGRKEGDDNRP